MTGNTEMGIESPFLEAVLVLLAMAAVYDALMFRIPNAIPGALLVLFVIHAGFSHHSVDAIGSFGAGAIVLGLALVPYRFGWLGGGDVKFVAALAVWVGLVRLAPFLLSVAVMGGVIALLLVAGRRLIGAAVTVSSRFMALELPRVLRPGEAMPYGVPIALAAALVLAELEPLRFLG